jgi:glycosyltransferase involved in cell wall biosynthesis
MAIFGRWRGRAIIDALGVIAGDQNGAERYFSNLICNLPPESLESCLVLVNGISADSFRARLGNRNVVQLPFRGANRVIRLLFQAFVVPLLVALHRPKVYVSTSLFPMHAISCRRICVILDLLLLHHPESYEVPERLFRRCLLHVSEGSAHAIITISQTSAEDIRESLGVRGQKPIHVVYPAADGFSHFSQEPETRNIIERLGLTPGGYVFSVLGGGAYKNPHRLIEAFRSLINTTGAKLDLVIVGDACFRLKMETLPPFVKVLGVVTDESLVALYRGAALFVFPSLFEGFGIPVIEAQTLGVPVACSKLDVLREVAGPGGALFFDPYSVESIADALQEGLANDVLRGGLRAAGRTNTNRFSWKASARRLWAACESFDRQDPADSGLPGEIIAGAGIESTQTESPVA